MRRLYDWMIAQAEKPFATWLCGLLSFAESSFSPIPPDLLLVPMIIAKPRRAWFLAALCSVTSVLGGLVGYLIGFYFFQAWGLEILEFYHLLPAFYKLQSWFEQWGFWVIILKGLTPIPFKVVTITCGAIHFPLMTFIVAALASRSLRFFLEGALFWKYGAPLHHYLRRHATKFTILLIAVLALGFALLWYAGRAL